jgi:toxin-antitoxin system PIN domain toxin
VILPDANLLLYAVNSDSPDHKEAFDWWKNLLQSDAEVGIYTGVAFAFVRLSTNRRIFSQPLSVRESFSYLNNWLEFRSVRLVDAELEDLSTAETLLIQAGTGANLVSDAQIAAAAIRLNGVVHSADTDFARFQGVKWLNPLET